MAKSLKRHSTFIRDLVTYGVGQVALKGLDVVSFAILVNSLDPAGLGFVGTMIMLGFLITDMFTLGVPRIGVPRYVGDDPDSSDTIRATGTAFCLIYTAVGAAILLLMPGSFLDRIGLGLSTTAFQLYTFSFVIRALVYMELEILRMQQKSMAQSILEALPSALNLLFLVLLLPFARDKLVISGLCQLLGWAPLFLWFSFTSLRRYGVKMDRMGEIMRYSVPLVVHRSMSELNNMGGRWIVLFTFGLAATGAYTFLSRLGELLKMALMPIQKAWFPALLRCARNGDDRAAGQMAMIYMACSTAAFVGLVLLHRPIAHLIDQEGAYVDYYSAIIPVAVAGWLTSYYWILGVGFFVAKRSAMIIPLTSLSAAICLVLSYVFARLGGVTAVPYASVCGSAVFALSTQYFGRRYFTIHYRPTWIMVWATLIGGSLIAYLVDHFVAL
ncbi:lipopolysaccharide biosynthesis protein [Sphingomonas oleivorans]|nr:oligosaccharide flippase family protein [Sphingomonas oleivorans]